MLRVSDVVFAVCVDAMLKRLARAHGSAPTEQQSFAQSQPVAPLAADSAHCFLLILSKLLECQTGQNKLARSKSWSKDSSEGKNSSGPSTPQRSSSGGNKQPRTQ